MLKILPSLPEMSIYLCHFALLATPFCLIQGSRRTLHSAALGQEEHWGTLTVRLICLALGVIYLTFQLYMLALCHHPPGHVATGCQSNSLPSPVLWHAKKMSNLRSWHLCPFFSFSLLIHGLFLISCLAVTLTGHTHLSSGFCGIKGGSSYLFSISGKNFRALSCLESPELTKDKLLQKRGSKEDSHSNSTPSLLPLSLWISLYATSGFSSAEWKKISFAPFSFPRGTEKLWGGLGDVKRHKYK